MFLILFSFFEIQYIRQFKACPIPYLMVGETIFVTIINNGTASQRAYPLFQKLQKWTIEN